MSTAEPLIAVTKLVKKHGPVTVLAGVDMHVGKGEVAVIIGPSGGGKSTLLRCVNALETFQGGEVRVLDLALHPTDARKHPEVLMKLRRRVGMVFQQFHLFPHMTALANVASGPILSLGEAREPSEARAKELLERVGLGHKLDARPEQLSGGQQQRVAIARALAVKPEAVLFDEPTSALDPRMSAEVLAVMTDLAKEGLTMMVVTHAMGFARRVATTVHVMHEGKVAESGPPARIFEDPHEEVTRAFLKEAEH